MFFSSRRSRRRSGESDGSSLLPLAVLVVVAIGALLGLMPMRAAAQAIQQISLVTKDLVYSAGTDRIYASVPSRAGAGGNSIAPITPMTGSVGTTVFVGSEPGRLTLTDDGQYLYVALDGAAGPGVAAGGRDTVRAGQRSVQRPVPCRRPGGRPRPA